MSSPARQSMQRIFTILSFSLAPFLGSCGGGTSGGDDATGAAKTVPQAPSNLSAVPLTQNSIELLWIDHATNETGFEIEGCLKGGAFLKIAAVSANVTSFRDTGLLAEQTYQYRVRAFNSKGSSSYSNMAETVTLGEAWAKSYSGPDDDSAYSVTRTREGGYVMAGGTRSFGQGMQDAWILLLDRDGSIAWQKAYGGENDDWIMSIIQTLDSGFLAVGSRREASGYAHLWVLKLDVLGTVVWQMSYGTEYHETVGIEANEAADGGFVVAGTLVEESGSDSDLWILKLDPNGGILWQKRYGGSGTEHAASIAATSDGGTVVASWTNSFVAGQFDYWVLKLNASGLVEWQRAIGDASMESPSSIAQTTDGGFIVAGFSGSLSPSTYWVLRLSPSGTVVWQRAYAGTGGPPSGARANSVLQAADGGFVVAGWAAPHAHVNDYWVLKLDSGGGIDWQKIYRGVSYDDAYAVGEAVDGGLIVAGESRSFGTGDSDIWLLKLNNDGSIDFNPSSNVELLDSLVSSIPTYAASVSTQADVSDTATVPMAADALVTDTLCTVKQQGP